MNYCHHCGNKLTDGSVFCSACGQKQSIPLQNSDATPTELTVKTPPNNKQLNKKESNSEPKNSGVSGGIFSQLTHSILSEANPVKLLSLFVYVSLGDAVLNYIVDSSGLIPDLTDDPSTPAAGFIAAMIMLAIPFLMFKFWGIPKRTKVPFLIYLIFVILAWFFVITDTPLIEEFSLYLKSHPNPIATLILFYIHFIAGIGFEALLAYQMMTNLEFEVESS